MASFEKADIEAKYAVIPKSTNSKKVALVAPAAVVSKKTVRTVLPEEKYVNELEKVIERDYFPELPRIRAQSDYCDAVARNDTAKIRELQLRFSTKRRTDRRTSPGQKGSRANNPMNRPTSPTRFDIDSPAPGRKLGSSPSRPTGEDDLDSIGNDLPFSNKEGNNEAQKKKPPGGDLSLTQFLSKFTSEDNASFEELATLQDRKERQRNAWMYDAEKRHNEEFIEPGPARIEAADVQLALRDAPDHVLQRSNRVGNWKYEARPSLIFYSGDEAPLTLEEQAKRSIQAQAFEINRKGTRFPTDAPVVKPNQSSMTRAAMMQAQANVGKVDVLGRDIGAVNPATLGLVATPSPAPGVSDTPLMTWGEIDGTPFRLDAADVNLAGTDAPAFKIPEVPVRDQLRDGLIDRMGSRFKTKREHAISEMEKKHKSARLGTASPRPGSATPVSKMSIMSPAAKKLATNKLGIRLSSDKMLKASYTPGHPSARTPQNIRASPAVGTPSQRTPVLLHSSSKQKSARAPQRASLPQDVTAGLFRLGDVQLQSSSSSSDPAHQQSDAGRARAADFF